MAEDIKITKRQFSEVQRQQDGKKRTIMKWFWLCLIIVLLILTYLLFWYINKTKNIAQNKKEVANTSRVPSLISSKDILDEQETYVGENFIIYTTPQGKVKVNRNGSIVYVDEDGNYNGGVSDVVKKEIVQEVKTLIDSDARIQNALEGFETSQKEKSNAESLNETAKLDLNSVEGKELQQVLDDKGWSSGVDGFINSVEDFLTSQDMTWNDMEKMADKLGLTTEEFLAELAKSSNRVNTFNDLKKEAEKKGFVSSSQKQEKREVNTSDSSIKTLGVEVTRLGQSAENKIEGSNSGQNISWVDIEKNNASLASQDEEVENSTNPMTALVNSLAQINGFTTETIDEKEKWVSNQQSSKVESGKLTKWDLAAGTVVPITIVTGIDSDLPGNIIGLVRQNVYDTLTGGNIVIPKGSRLVATYNSSISFGQKSLQIAWNYLITPDGYTFTLPGFQGIDAQGYTGVKGSVNNHYLSLLTATAFGTIIDYGAEIISTVSGTAIEKTVSNTVASELIGLLIEGETTAVQSVGQQYVQKAVNQNPTIKIKSGTQTQMLVNQTVSLKRE